MMQSPAVVTVTEKPVVLPRTGCLRNALLSKSRLLTSHERIENTEGRASELPLIPLEKQRTHISHSSLGKTGGNTFE